MRTDCSEEISKNANEAPSQLGVPPRSAPNREPVLGNCFSHDGERREPIPEVWNPYVERVPIFRLKGDLRNIGRGEVGEVGVASQSISNGGSYI